MKLTALALFLVALPAYAEFALIEQTETMTVHQDGSQYIVLTDARGRATIRLVALERGPENIASKNFRSQVSGKDLFYFYFVRTRMLDGQPICEKFATRLKEESDRAFQLQALALAPCG